LSETIGVFYIVYWGAAEPLGQSLVLPTIRRFAASGRVRLTLVTFEKENNTENVADRSEIRAELATLGVDWHPLRYHKTPKWPATAYDVVRGVWSGLLDRVAGRFDVVHARTFLGGLMGLPIAGLAGRPLIYHNEGFYPDEQVDGGVWKADSLPHRVARQLESLLYSRSDAVITLSHRARVEVEERPAVRAKHTPVVVVPSVVDWRRFQPLPARAVRDSKRLRLVYLGSVGARYQLGGVARFALIASRMWSWCHLRILSRSDPSLVENLVGKAGLPRAAWSLDRVAHERIPEELGGQDAGMFFLARGMSEHACSPTKIGEYWAAGLPVVTTPNVSDTDGIVARERVGVVVRGHTDEDYERALRELQELLTDPDVSSRCQAAAANHYDLDGACERQLDLYERLAADGRRLA
jgi:glycosyltransferase involved in cell wall biosynthesis